MGEKTQVTTAEAPRNDNPYSQGVVADGFLFVSGFGPVDPETMTDVGGTSASRPTAYSGTSKRS